MGAASTKAPNMPIPSSIEESAEKASSKWSTSPTTRNSTAFVWGCSERNERNVCVCGASSSASRMNTSTWDASNAVKVKRIPSVSMRRPAIFSALVCPRIRAAGNSLRTASRILSASSSGISHCVTIVTSSISMCGIFARFPFASMTVR